MNAHCGWGHSAEDYRWMVVEARDPAGKTALLSISSEEGERGKREARHDGNGESHWAFSDSKFTEHAGC